MFVSEYEKCDKQAIIRDDGFAESKNVQNTMRI
jgi:hypothetical protein